MTRDIEGKAALVKSVSWHNIIMPNPKVAEEMRVEAAVIAVALSLVASDCYSSKSRTKSSHYSSSSIVVEVLKMTLIVVGV